MMKILPHRILLFLDVIASMRTDEWKTSESNTAEEGVPTTSNPRGVSRHILFAVLTRLDWSGETIDRTIAMVRWWQPTPSWWHSEWRYLLEAREILRRNCSAESQHWTMPPLGDPYTLAPSALAMREAQIRLLHAIASGELTETNFRDGAQ